MAVAVGAEKVGDRGLEGRRMDGARALGSRGDGGVNIRGVVGFVKAYIHIHYTRFYIVSSHNKRSVAIRSLFLC